VNNAHLVDEARFFDLTTQSILQVSGFAVAQSLRFRPSF